MKGYKRGDAEQGSPAHAGIDLDTMRKEGLVTGFPRTRGDRPAPPRRACCHRMVPPHTRG